MHKPDRRCSWIYNVNRAAVGDVNAERDTAFAGDEAIAAGEFAAINSAGDSGRYSAFDNCNFVSMNLFRSEQRPIAEPDRVANFVMRSVEPL
jgi:hypothetical protein